MDIWYVFFVVFNGYFISYVGSYVYILCYYCVIWDLMVLNDKNVEYEIMN